MLNKLNVRNKRKKLTDHSRLFFSDLTVIDQISYSYFLRQAYFACCRRRIRGTHVEVKLTQMHEQTNIFPRVPFLFIILRFITHKIT